MRKGVQSCQFQSETPKGEIGQIWCSQTPPPLRNHSGREKSGEDFWREVSGSSELQSCPSLHVPRGRASMGPPENSVGVYGAWRTLSPVVHLTPHTSRGQEFVVGYCTGRGAEKGCWTKDGWLLEISQHKVWAT